MKKSIIAAGAASIALAAMPVVGVFADVSDTITVQVNPSCTFTTGGSGVEYTASGANGASVSPANNSSSTHSFVVFCNNGAGYTVSASAESLATTGASPVTGFTYTATTSTTSGTAGKWHAQVASEVETEGYTVSQIADNGSSSNIITLSGKPSAAGGEAFTVTYSAYIGSETPAGTYTGHASYTLTPGA